MTIDQATTEQLKAAAYDELARIEQSKANLQVINAEIAKRNQPMEEVKTDETVVEPTEGTPLEVGEVTPEPEAE